MVILDPIEKATDVLGGSKYVNLSLLQPLVPWLKVRCMQLSSQDGESYAAKQFRTILLEELELKFGSSPTFVSTLSEALDPRFR